MEKISLAKRARYWFDNFMAKGLLALIGLLSVLTVVFVVALTLPVLIFGIYPTDGESVGEIIWFSLMHAIDPGTVVGAEGVGYRLVMLAVTFGGLVVVAALISVVSGAFDAKVADLRKGRSRVIEKDHTLILGWNSKIFEIAAEICIANESRKKSSIVILAEGDKVAMEDELSQLVPKRFGTKIVVRSGNPMAMTDLEIVNHRDARSIIILATDEELDPDLVVLKTTMALVNNPNRSAGKYHIVAEIKDANNFEAANLVSKTEASWVLGSDIMSRLMVQTSRQSGLSVVFTELLDFQGVEIYFTSQPALIGKTYRDAQFAFAESTVMGLLSEGKVDLSPDASRQIDAGDQLIVIAEDDSLISLAEPLTPNREAISTKRSAKPKPETTLILGFNRSGQLILKELDEFMPAGSIVTVMTSAAVAGPVKTAKMRNITLVFKTGNAASRADLEALNLAKFDHIMILANTGELSPQRADALTLVTLLHLRDMAKQAGKTFRVVSEMLIDANRELAEASDADDFIVSDKLVSLMMSQLAENPKLAAVFEYLFSSAGSEIGLQSAELYVKLGVETDFYTVTEAAIGRGQTALGYRVAAQARRPDASFGVRLNPTKTDRLVFEPGDKIIVLADA